MSEGLSGFVLRVFKVPPEPHLPAGAPETARVFRAGENFWRLKVLGWAVRQALTLAGFLFMTVMLWRAGEPGTVPFKNGAVPVGFLTWLAAVRVFELAAWGLWLVQLPVTYAILRLDYELRWYIVTDRAARLREGIVSLKEMTLTLANVQDIRLRQGPLQRLLGLADVELRTAGGSEVAAGAPGHGGHVAENLHLARFRGVDNAEAIRDLVIDRMKRARGAGLGDPDDHRGETMATTPAGAADVAAAARALAAESALLRAALRS
jgi:membrane protein YdbS with pleckstrin-like domain